MEGQGGDRIEVEDWRKCLSSNKAEDARRPSRHNIFEWVAPACLSWSAMVEDHRQSRQRYNGIVDFRFVIHLKEGQISLVIYLVRVLIWRFTVDSLPTDITSGVPVRKIETAAGPATSTLSATSSLGRRRSSTAPRPPTHAQSKSRALRPDTCSRRVQSCSRNRFSSCQ